MNELWSDIAKRAGLTLSEHQASLLHRYLDLLLEANERMNLTRIQTREEAERLHVADALTLLPHLPNQPIALADLGSGGGVPGIPLAIVRPDVLVTLVESTRKKAIYLRETANALELQNVTVVDDRAETFGRSKEREKFDVVTARAVGALAWLIEWAMPLLKIGGTLLAMKGERITTEIPEAGRAIRLLGAADPVVHPVELPGATSHVIVSVTKTKLTAKPYPRDATAHRGKAL